MSLLFDPLYPTQVQYIVSQSIWELYEVHFWQLLTKSWGKDRVFLYLQNRYERKHRETPALFLMIMVFIITYLVQFLMMRYRQTVPPPAQNSNNEGANDQNRENDGNGGQNQDNEGANDQNRENDGNGGQNRDNGGGVGNNEPNDGQRDPTNDQN